MANTRISTAAAQAALDAITLLLDSGGYIEFRTGSPPATCETADSGTLIATLNLSTDSFPAASDGTNKATASANTITSDTNADATGTIGHFRAKTSGAAVVIQGDVTVTSGGGDIELSTVSVDAGDTVALSTWTLNIPE